MIAGTVTVIVYKQLEGGIFDLYELLPGFIAGTAAILVFSRGSGVSSTCRATHEAVWKRLSKR